jgi:hypothetical protein
LYGQRLKTNHIVAFHAPLACAFFPVWESDRGRRARPLTLAQLSTSSRIRTKRVVPRLNRCPLLIPTQRIRSGEGAGEMWREARPQSPLLPRSLSACAAAARENRN